MYFPHLVRFLSKNTPQFTIVNSMKELESVDVLSITGVILSGSPLFVARESMTLSNMDHYLVNIMAIVGFDVPIIGICFGCQLINFLFRGTLTKLEKTFCEDATVTIANDKIKARFCLNYIIDRVSPDFDVVATAEVRKKVIPCVIKHKHRPVMGCLFHPEFHTATHQVLYDFLDLCKRKLKFK